MEFCGPGVITLTELKKKKKTDSHDNIWSLVLFMELCLSVCCFELMSIDPPLSSFYWSSLSIWVAICNETHPLELN